MKIDKKGTSASLTSGVLYGANSSFARNWTTNSNSSQMFTSTSTMNTIASTTYLTGFREVIAFIGIMVSVLIIRPTFNPIKKAIKYKDVRAVALIAMLAGAPAQFLFFTSLSIITPALISIFTGTWILFTVIFSRIMLKKKYATLTWIGVVIIMVGTALTSFTAINEINDTFISIVIGISMALTTALLWALQMVLVDKALSNSECKLNFYETNFFRYGVSAVTFTIIFIIFSISNKYDFALIGSALASVGLVWVLLAGFNAAFTNLLLHLGMSQIGSVMAAVFQASNVVLALFWAALLVGEDITPMKVVSALVVMAGMMAAIYGQRVDINKK